MCSTTLSKIMRTIDDIARFNGVTEEFIEESRKYWYFKHVIFDDKKPEEARAEYPMMSRFPNQREFTEWYTTVICLQLEEANAKEELDKRTKNIMKWLFDLYSMVTDDVTIFPIVEKKINGYVINSTGIRAETMVRPEAILPNGKRIPLTYQGKCLEKRQEK